MINCRPGRSCCSVLKKFLTLLVSVAILTPNRGKRAAALSRCRARRLTALRSSCFRQVQPLRVMADGSPASDDGAIRDRPPQGASRAANHGTRSPSVMFITPPNAAARVPHREQPTGEQPSAFSFVPGGEVSGKPRPSIETTRCA